MKIVDINDLPYYENGKYKSLDAYDTLSYKIHKGMKKVSEGLNKDYNKNYNIESNIIEQFRG